MSRIRTRERTGIVILSSSIRKAADASHREEPDILGEKKTAEASARFAHHIFADRELSTHPTQDVLFACLYALVKERSPDSRQFSYFKVLKVMHDRAC